jgi:protein-disulfide isomerase
MKRSEAKGNRPDLTIRDDDHVTGPTTAAVTLVAYCDFECPYCGEAYPVIKQLQVELAERLRYVFRHFPLSDKHPFAEQAAEAAEAAGAQGQFWAMHDLLFEHQESLDQENLYVYAESLGIDMERFVQDLGGRRYATRVERDVKSGRRNGVRGTPTCFVNGIRQTDDESLEDLVWRVNDHTRLS